ncbi:MAG: redoxin domain-containing protein [Jatrophihabitans sp.]|uniref:redoxin domain-containing protein n=1 Tax=Jatrophihabitans sp. TaxID=1932789 RepID=UPI003911E754
MRAPEFVAGDWFNTAAPLTLRQLRGRFVVLDFWTFACGNCLHVLDELRPLETELGEILTVVGIHSPKFPHEAEPAALRAAIERYEVHHPVLNDPEMQLWRQYAVRAWPTLVLIDPEGYVVAQAAGEGQVSALAAIVARLAAEHDARGTLRRGDGPYEPPAPQSSTLRFPAKAVVLPAARTGRATDSLLVADAGHHQLVEFELDGETELRRFGSGRRGGPFAEPNGLGVLPVGVAAYDVVVADTANHVLRGVRLADGAITAIDLPAGLADIRTVTGPVPPVLSPWDVAWWPAIQRIVVAAAGVHLLLTVDPADGRVAILAGTTVEGLRDGPAADAWLAQPSGLAVDGDRVWFVDSESSALRWIDAAGTVGTAVGEGLFDFGFVDGPAATARLQHPLGVTVLADRSVAVLDTYNGAVRRYDPAPGAVTTLARDLAEPSGALLVGGELVVVESAAHRLVRPVPTAELVTGVPLHTQRPAAHLAAGRVQLTIAFEPAPGRKLDDRYGPSTSLTVTSSPPELLAAGAGDTVTLDRTLELTPGQGVLHVTAQAASCDAAGADNPACYLARQDWGVPVDVAASGDTELRLVLLG